MPQRGSNSFGSAMMLPRERLDPVERFHETCTQQPTHEVAMMRIRSIPTSVTLLMLAIILAAPIVTNTFLAISQAHAG